MERFMVRSDFCSGNGALDHVKVDGTYVIAVSCDGEDTPTPAQQYRTWFYFAIEGGGAKRGESIKIQVVNLNKQGKLYNYGMKPVMRSASQSRFKRIKGSSFQYQEEVMRPKQILQFVWASDADVAI